MANGRLQSVYNSSSLLAFLLMLFTCSAVGPLHGLQSFRENLLLDAILHSLLFLLDISACSGMILSTGFRLDICSIVVLSTGCRTNLLHYGPFQWKPCSGSWSTSSYSFFSSQSCSFHYFFFTYCLCIILPLLQCSPQGAIISADMATSPSIFLGSPSLLAIGAACEAEKALTL